MMIDRHTGDGHAPGVPGPEPQRLSPKQVRELERAHAERAKAKHDADLAWAKVIRRLGISACAREMRITPSALSGRIRLIERGE